MRLRTVVMLTLALLLGAAAVFLARSWLSQQVQQVQQAQPAVDKAENAPVTTVVVASTTLFFGNRLEPNLVKEIQWPANSVPEGVFHTVNELLSGTEPRMVLRRIDAGEPILTGKVTGTGQRATLSTLVKEDTRAVTIRVNDVVGVAGFILPGDHVDVLLTREIESGNSKSMTTGVLLQNVRVLGIDQETSEQQDKPQVVKSVTVEVTPEEGQKLVLGQQVGTLNLALRNHVDIAETEHKIVSVKDLGTGEFNTEPPKAPEPPPKIIARAPEPPDLHRLVTITRGTTADDYRVEPEGGLPGGSRHPRVFRASRHQAEEPTGAEEAAPSADRKSVV